MRNATLLFLTRIANGAPTEVCLAMKKRGFGAGRYNGAGGKVKDGETIEEAVRREAEEELMVTPGELTKVAELTFTFPHNPAFDQVVHVYMTGAWVGDPTETEEMAPRWFPVSEIPYDTMWSDDILWLPQVLEGKHIRGTFTFTDDEQVAEHSIIETTFS